MPSIERWCSSIRDSSAVGSLTEFAHWCLSGAGCKQQDSVQNWNRAVWAASSWRSHPRRWRVHIDAVTTGDYLALMKAIGVKELKARLSEYLRAVKAGETVLVTDRDQVVAELRPVRPRTAPHDTVEQLLDALAQSGEISRARLTKGHWVWRPRGLGLPPGTAETELDAVRTERHAE